MPEPAVKVLLENARCGGARSDFAPGSGDTHTHQWAHVGVILTKGSLASPMPAKPEETVAFEAGAVGFREAKVTHLARNPGTTPDEGLSRSRSSRAPGTLAGAPSAAGCIP